MQIKSKALAEVEKCEECQVLRSADKIVRRLMGGKYDMILSGLRDIPVHISLTERFCQGFIEDLSPCIGHINVSIMSGAQIISNEKKLKVMFFKKNLI